MTQQAADERSWMKGGGARPRVVILGAPDRERVTTELKRLGPSSRLARTSWRKT